MPPRPNDSSKYIDISVAVSPDLPVWPGSTPIEFQRTLDLSDGDEATDTTLHLSVHTGTHVDAPMHFIPGGRSVEALPLEMLIGPAYVAEVDATVGVITAEILQRLTIPPGTQRLLLHTRNSALWQQREREFDPNFVALSADAAQWVVDQGIQLVGVDYLSVQRFYDGPETHQILLGAEVVVIEGLNLTAVAAGIYDLLCLPIKLQGLEGAPARVLLKPR